MANANALARGDVNFIVPPGTGSEVV
jgi:hypothetical protein